METLFSAFELILQSLLYILIAVLGRAILKELSLNRLSFYKTAQHATRNWVAGWIVDLSRSGLQLKERFLSVLVLAIYTASIAVLFGSAAEDLKSTRVEVVFTILLLFGSVARVFLSDTKGGELRQANLVPLFAVLLLTLYESIFLISGVSHFSELEQTGFLFLSNPPLFLAFWICISLSFFLFLACRTRAPRRGWSSLVNHVFEVAWIAPALMIFLTPYGFTGWILVLVLSFEAIFFLFLMDFVAAFFPVFQGLQTEKFTIRVAIPTVLAIFVIIWTFGALA